MATRKPDPLEVIENIPPIDPDSEPTDQESSPPWSQPQLVTKAQTPTDKQLFREKLIA